jgi:putative DNA primase/helicase
VAEGIETALAASQLSGRPAWACLSAHGMESLQLHHPVRDVLIAADNDANEAGQNAARALARRLLAAGLVARMRWPDVPGTDWLDVLNSLGVQP